MPESRAGGAAAASKWLCRRYRWLLLLIVAVLVGQLLLGFLLPKQHTGDDDSGHGKHLLDEAGVGPRNQQQLSSTAVPATLSASHLTTTTQPPQHTLRAGEVSLPVNCTITTREAVSAIHRATTRSCKQRIANVTCAIQAGRFYARTLPNTCPNGSFIANRALGCYRDQKTARLLDGYYTNFKQLNSPGKCIQLCLQSGFLYAGVQYGTECFCGNAEPAAEARLETGDRCSYACVGEPEQRCGGYFAMNVYETGISKFVPQVAGEQPPTNTTDSVRIVFLLTLNGRAVRQVHRLLRALYTPHHFYYIHVDSRQSYLYEQLLPLEQHAPNIRLTRRRFSTIWGGASLLTMLLSAMAELQATDWPWDFVINLSESDFPVKAVDRLAEFLTANRDRNFVKSHGREVQRFIQKQGLDKTFVECDTHMWRTGDRQLPAGLQIDGGSDWVALSRPFVRFVTQERRDALVAGLLRLFEHTLLPAESFFHTALRNSPFCNTYVDNNLHVTNWKRKLGCKCQYKHVVDWCGCSPNDFRPDDWQRLMATEAKQVFFARKFEPVVSQAVVLKLEAWLYGQRRGRWAAVDGDGVEPTNVRSYWQNVWEWPATGDGDQRRPEPALYDVAESVVRLQFGAELLGIERITQVNIYMENDQHRGFLVRAWCRLQLSTNGTTAADGVELEVWARHEQLPQASRSLPIGRRIVHLEVSSDFDQKEQIARNFVRILGAQSEPVLVMHFSEPAAAAAAAAAAAPATPTTPATVNLTCLWISPAGVLEEASAMPVEENAPGAGYSVHFSRPALRRPLVAGVWMVRVVHGRHLVGKCDFFVMPTMEPTATATPIDESALLNRTLAKPEPWMRALAPTDEERAVQMERALREWRSVGAERERWVDTMVRRFVVLRDWCLVAVVPGGANGTRPLCGETSWSSLAPDPKSDIYADLAAAAAAEAAPSTS